jgi:predicted nucleotidyltransferase
MPPHVENHLLEIAGLCRQFGIRRLAVFGSSATEEFDPRRSDVDFLVEFYPGTDFGPWLRKLTDLKTALQNLLHLPVDVVTTAALENPHFRREAERTMRTVYDASEGAEVAR